MLVLGDLGGQVTSILQSKGDVGLAGNGHLDDLGWVLSAKDASDTCQASWMGTFTTWLITWAGGAGIGIGTGTVTCLM